MVINISGLCIEFVRDHLGESDILPITLFNYAQMKETIIFAIPPLWPEHTCQLSPKANDMLCPRSISASLTPAQNYKLRNFHF